MVTFGDAEIGGPTIVLLIPAAVDVVKTCQVLEIRAVDGELVVRVELAL